MSAAAQVAVNWQSFATQIPCLTPPPARSVAVVRPVVPTPQDWYLDRLPQAFPISLDHLLHLLGQFMTWHENGYLLPGTRWCDVIKEQVSEALLFLLLGLIAGGPLHRPLRLPETGWASYQKLPGGRPAFGMPPPKEELLDDFAKLLSGLLDREEGGAGAWREGVQYAPEDCEVVACHPRAGEAGTHASA
jgi:hypothetical protein